MNLLHYPFFINENSSSYEFASIGPKGTIRKVVKYVLVHKEPLIYNLGFGDVDIHGEINDFAVSNNHDREKVLATVANTVLDFCGQNPDCWIVAEGSTRSRTILYQMGIAAFWSEISTEFEVFGLIHSRWHPFEVNMNFDAFMVKKKITKFE